MDQGKLRIRVIAKENGNPISGARIALSYTGVPGTPLEELKTDSSGNAEEVTLNTPPLEYSQTPSEEQPYSEFTIEVSALGFRPVNISGIDVLANETSTQEVYLEPQSTPGNDIQNIVIGANTLYGNFPPKIPEEEIKTVNDNGAIVLNRVVIPEFIVVHDGPPNDDTATNYYVRYRDYIKNVASSEIYATWPDATIRANVLAIMSFTLNRVYTEW